MNLKGASAFVTGGGSGLGAATARKLAERGAKVTVFDLNKDGAEAVAKEIGGIAVTGDVCSEADAKAAFEKADANGPLRVLINCAGIGNAITTVNKNGPFPLDGRRGPVVLGRCFVRGSGHRRLPTTTAGRTRRVTTASARPAWTATRRRAGSGCPSSAARRPPW